jgi:hypothetical protein
MKILSTEQIVENLLAVVKSLQETPWRWDEEARREATSLSEDLFSLAEALE